MSIQVLLFHRPPRLHLFRLFEEKKGNQTTRRKALHVPDAKNMAVCTATFAPQGTAVAAHSSLILVVNVDSASNVTVKIVTVVFIRGGSCVDQLGVNNVG